MAAFDDQTVYIAGTVGTATPGLLILEGDDDAAHQLMVRRLGEEQLARVVVCCEVLESTLTDARLVAALRLLPTRSLVTKTNEAAQIAVMGTSTPVGQLRVVPSEGARSLHD